MDNVVVGTLVIFASEDGEKNWKPVKPEDVPAWLQKPSTLGIMLDGLLANDPAHDPRWFAAVRIPDKSRGEVRPPEKQIAESRPRILVPGPDTPQ